MEERAGEKRRVCLDAMELPLSSVLSPLLRRGERKKNAQGKIFAERNEVGRYYSTTKRSVCPGLDGLGRR
jgi:hypothetical protein